MGAYPGDGSHAPAYPLEFALDEGPVLLRTTDAAGRQVSCVYKRGSGPRHATIYGDESLRRVRFLVEDEAPDRQRFLEDLRREKKPLRDLKNPYLADPDPSARRSGDPGPVIRGPDGRLLGRLTNPAGAWEVIWRGTYDVADATGENVGRIFRDNPFLPARRVELRGANVLRLRRHGPRDAYQLEKTAGLPPQDETLLLASVTAVILMDWWRDHG